MSSETMQFRDVSPPGEILSEALEERGMSQADLARRIERSEKHVSQLINAHVPLTMEVARELERALGISARFWMNLEFNYRSEIERTAERERLGEHAAWARRFPIREMIRCGYMKECGSGVADRVEALLDFFGVASPDGWEAEWKGATAKLRQSHRLIPDKYALTAWLRFSQLQAQTISCAVFDAAAFSDALIGVRKLTRASVSTFTKDLPSTCASVGVAVTFTPALPKLAVSGATRWMSSTAAAIHLSLRHKTDDQLWFSFFHEAKHVLERRTTAVFVDLSGNPDEEPDERRANEFARDILISATDYASFISCGDLTQSAIERFAIQIGVSPGVVVGRLQFDKHIPYSRCNGLKRRFRWSFEC